MSGIFKLFLLLILLGHSLAWFFPLSRLRPRTSGPPGISSLESQEPPFPWNVVLQAKTDVFEALLREVNATLIVKNDELQHLLAAKDDVF